MSIRISTDIHSIFLKDIPELFKNYEYNGKLLFEKRKKQKIQKHIRLFIIKAINIAQGGGLDFAKA